MNKKLSYIMLAVLFFTVLIFSCQIPSKIEIIANPTIKASAGTLDVSLSDYLSPDLFSSMFGEDSMISIYEYKTSSSDESLRYLLKMNMDVPLDGLDFDSVMDDAFAQDPIEFGYDEDGNPTTLFTAPEIDMDMNVSAVTINFSDLNSSASSFGPVNLPFAGTGGEEQVFNESTGCYLEVNLCSDSSQGSFSSVTYKTGAVMKVTFGNATANTANVTKVYLKDSTGTIASSTSTIDLVNGTGDELVASLDVGGKTLESTFKVCFEITVNKDGSDEDTVSLSLDGSSAEVSKVTGFTRENFEVPIAEQEISLGIDTFKQATIAADSGSLALALSMPTGITQNSLTFDISQDDDGTYTGLSLADAAVTDGEIDLSGQNLNTNAVKMSGTLNIS
ncbi:MAG: hypothetical protein K5839_00970, partial [Treponemataceae bacterium]|nr:hypothetical protein [Treponemataceae bacterium]